MFKALLKGSKYLNLGILVLVLFSAFSTSYVFGLKMMQVEGDLFVHSMLANAYLNGTFQSSYPGYYLTFGFFSRILGLPDIHAAASSMGLFSVLTGIVVYILSGCYLGREDFGTERVLLVLFMSFFGPLNLGGNHYYVGQGSFNTWHNPTNSSVKFLALICFYLFVYIYEINNNDHVAVGGRKFTRTQLYLLLVAFTCCSLVFKPSFFQVFAPTLVIIYGVDFLTGKRTFGSCIKDAVLFLPALAIILYQMYVNFLSSDSSGGIAICFAQGWSFHSDNIFRSIMTFAIFPIFVCLACWKTASENRMLYFAIIFYLVGIAEGLFLVESGPRIGDGNFLWGKNLAIGIIYFAAVSVFIKHIKVNLQRKSTIITAVLGFGLLSMHFLRGVVYIVRCISASVQYY